MTEWMESIRGGIYKRLTAKEYSVLLAFTKISEWNIRRNRRFLSDFKLMGNEGW